MGLEEYNSKEKERRDLILRILCPQFKKVFWDEKQKYVLVAEGLNSKVAKYSTTEDSLEQTEGNGMEKGEVRTIKKMKEGDEELLNRLERAYLRARMAVYPLS